MNKKIKKYLDEIAKTEKKIADLQQYRRGVQAALKQEEDNEMIRCIPVSYTHLTLPTNSLV